MSTAGPPPPDGADVSTTFHVLVPAYGPSPYLGRTLRSVLAAADEATFVTVVDDGSPGTDVERTATEVGDRVEYLRLDPNRGVAGAFQACAELSRGTYTALVGSDDEVMNHFVTDLRELVSRFGHVDMLTTGVEVIDGAGTGTLPLVDRVKRAIGPHGDEPRLLRGQRLVASLALGNWLYFPAVAWRTDVLRRHGFRQDMTTALDLDLELRVVLGGGALARSPRPAFRYRRHQQSVSSRSAVSGSRFGEERAVYHWLSHESRRRGWLLAAGAAAARPTSRVHALLAAAGRRSTGDPAGAGR